MFNFEVVFSNLKTKKCCTFFIALCEQLTENIFLVNVYKRKKCKLKQFPNQINTLKSKSL